MISLTLEMTDSKGRRARAWLFFDAECVFCTRVTMGLAAPLHRRGLAVAPLQDQRVGALLGLSREELLSAIQFVCDDGTQCAGADAALAVAREFWWARPPLWGARVPGVISTLRTAYCWVAHLRHCPAGHCPVGQVHSGN